MTPIDRWRNELLRAVADARLLERSHRVQLTGSTHALQGRLSVADRVVMVALVVDPLFENKLPIVLIQPWDALGFIPHVDPSGIICYLDHEQLLLDQRRQLQIIREALQRVQKTLQDGLVGANLDDFVNEFEVYWQRLNGVVIVLSSLEPCDEVGRVVIGINADAHVPLRLAPDENSLRQVPDLPGRRGPWQVQRALYLPLESGTRLIPPRPDRPFWSSDDVRALLAHCSEANRERVMRLLTVQQRDLAYVVVCLPRPAGGTALFGIRFEGMGDRHPLMDGGTAARLTPIAVVRRDRSFLVQRGGGNDALRDARVLLLGCGSVGGHIAHELARAGVGCVTLVDPDILMAENTYRHELGKGAWGRNKAEAITSTLKAQLPYLRVEAIPTTIESALERNLLQLHDFDLIVSALGNPTSELDLNERVRRAGGPPIIFTWLEPLSIGGHAVSTGVGGEAGCFECLYTTPDDEAVALSNRASFARSDKPFHRSLEGCGSLYTPYGSLDAIQTAVLAVRLTIDMLTSAQRGNTLRSWKGDDTALLAAGFATTNRYRLTLEALAAGGAHFSSPRCRICGTEHVAP